MPSLWSRTVVSNSHMLGREVSFSIGEKVVGICATCGARVYSDEDFSVNDDFDPVCEKCCSDSAE